ncbi:MAG: AI-2E family transporter [Crocinitomicaceae bacterium]|nr:AI-2E family transporter [Crocinitomicaceae bacterium]
MKEKQGKWLIVVLIVIGFGLICYVFSKILIYLIAAVVIGFIGDPVVQLLSRVRIRKWRIPSSLSAFVALLLFTSFIVAIFWLTAPLITQEISLLSTLDTGKAIEALQSRVSSFSNWFDSLGLAYNSSDLYDYIITQTKQLVSFQWVGGFFSNVFGFVTEFLAAFFSILFMSFFFLKERSLFPRIVFVLTPDRYIVQVKSILSKSHSMLVRYFVGLFLQILIMIAMITIGLSLLGVKNALLIGLFAGLLNVIPYIGPLMAAVLGLLIGITTGLGNDPDLVIFPVVIRIIVVFGIAQFIDNWFVQPLIIGNSVKVHPLEFFIILLAAGTVGGMTGLVIALPVYTIIRIVVKEFFDQFKIVKMMTRDIGD